MFEIMYLRKRQFETETFIIRKKKVEIGLE